MVIIYGLVNHHLVVTFNNTKGIIIITSPSLDHLPLTIHGSAVHHGPPPRIAEIWPHPPLLALGP